MVLLRHAAPAHRLSAMKLEAELRYKSEDIDNRVLLDAVKAIRRRVRVVNRSYDIPYIAGYSVDGHKRGWAHRLHRSPFAAQFPLPPENGAG
jgi:hypothetical protein